MKKTITIRGRKYWKTVREIERNQKRRLRKYLAHRQSRKYAGLDEGPGSPAR